MAQEQEKSAQQQRGKFAVAGQNLGAPEGRYITVREISRFSGLKEGTVRWRIRQALAGKKWRGAVLQVRQVPCRGGAAGTQHEVLLSSLPPDLQAEWYKRQPAGLPAGVRDQLAELERRRVSAAGRGPWAQEDRDARHAAYSRILSRWLSVEYC